jgi:hypothetical protein
VNLKSLLSKNPNTLWKVIFSLTLILISLGIIRLFSFSSELNNNDSLYKRYFSENYKIFAVNIPDNLNFAGESVPIQDFEVRERIDREFLVNTYWQSQTLLLIKRANRWMPLIEPILKRNGIPSDFKYLAVAESGFLHGVSSKGATGFWQFIPGTAEAYGLTINDEIDERYHVEKSTEAACKFFKESYSNFNNWTLVAASYNLGITGINKQLQKQKVNNYYDLLLNEETSRYIFRVLALKQILQFPKDYGFNIRKKDLYAPLPFKNIEIDSTITDLILFAESNNINYKLLKYFNPWLRSDKLTNIERKKYTIKIPLPSVKNYDELMQIAENEQPNYNEAIIDSIK